MGKPYIFSRGQRSLLRRLRLRSSLRSQASHLERLGERNTKNCDVVASSCKFFFFIYIYIYIYLFIFIDLYLLMIYICIYIYIYMRPHMMYVWCIFWCIYIFMCTACASHTIYIQYTEILFLNRSTLHIFAQHSNMLIYQACNTSWRRYPLSVYISVFNQQKPYWLWALEIACG